MAGIYIHIPFCSSRCIYCGFFSTTNLNQRERYTAALCKELKMRCKELQEEKISTIYFGGGTPSLLSQHQLKQIFNTIEDCFNISEVQEITLECNPDDISDTFLNSLKDLPINRISMGIQSFNDATLHFLRRRHNSLQAINAVKKCKDAGYNNISIDLIYGIPGQNSEIFKSDIETAVSLDVTHISSYHLSYEEDTPIWQMLIDKKIDSIDEYMSLPASLIPNDADVFTLQVNGDSMMNIGIYDNDIVIVKKQKTANNGEIVVALI
ncbi:MAG: radical SAM family heme chaperone HemW, partial [Bacteroidaceae bacterium]|nr:radical SAM family heme chaperone HemW [Bacteroidaceae bacterium]